MMNGNETERKHESPDFSRGECQHSIFGTHNASEGNNDIGSHTTIHSQNHITEGVPEVDVIVCTKNSRSTLERCLQSVKDNIPYHRIIVVDGASSDGSQEIAASFGAEVYSEAVGLSHAREFGIKLVDCPFLAFVDSDVVITSNWYPTLMNEFKDSMVGSVQGFLVPLDRERRQFFEFWHKVIRGKKEGFQTHNTIIRTKVVKDWHCDTITNYYEFSLLAKHIHSKGYRTVETRHRTWHLSEWSNKHAFNAGKAYTRIFGFKLHKLLWRILTPIKTIPPAIFYINPQIVYSYSAYWFHYASGMLRGRSNIEDRASK